MDLVTIVNLDIKWVRIMSDKSEKLEKIINEQIEVEKQTLTELLEAEETAAETAVKLLYMEMRLDTWKHIKFLEGVRDLITKVPCSDWSEKVQRYVDRVKVERKLREIQSRESRMSELLTQALGVIEDPFATLLLTHLKEDEDRHVEDLEQMCRIIQTLPLQKPGTRLGSEDKC